VFAVACMGVTGAGWRGAAESRFSTPSSRPGPRSEVAAVAGGGGFAAAALCLGGGRRLDRAGAGSVRARVCAPGLSWGLAGPGDQAVLDSGLPGPRTAICQLIFERERERERERESERERERERETERLRERERD
jgi:hypothetical protein